MPSAVAAADRGRAAYAENDWVEAYESLSAADRAQPLDADDLELLARAAYLLGHEDEFVANLERAHRIHLGAGRDLAAADCAFWIGFRLAFQGEDAPSSGWFARARRLTDGRETVLAGYLLIPVWIEQMTSGDWEGGCANTIEAAAIGERFGDPDLVALAEIELGQGLMAQGKVVEGLRLVDESMVAVTSGELSPIVAGIVYCNTIDFCRRAQELRRAREWTAALTRWCEQQSGMVAHTGICLVHRAELMTLGGDWREALDELRGLAERFDQGALGRHARAHGAYQRGEVLRLRGDFDAAEAAYRDASKLGREPQPGLALLRLSQGNGEAAAAAITRAIDETTEEIERTGLLPALVEIKLATGNPAEARSASLELRGIAERRRSEALMAMSAHAAGVVALAEDDPVEALAETRRAWRAWEDLGAPHEAARARALVGLACRALGDEDGAALALEAAREDFERLGAAPDIAWVDSIIAPEGTGPAHGLTDRELEVLRLVAEGRSNREIAEALTISEHTAARHLQNIFAKLRVSSRTAAVAFAFEHGLV